MRVWITGGRGLIGSALQTILHQKKIPFAASGKELDIADSKALSRFWQEEGPFTHLVNCAAYTKVDLAQLEVSAAEQVNSYALTQLGRFAREKQLHVLHLSTDYVFDGQAKVPYREEDPKAPQTVYGRTKSEGEERLLQELPSACIVRTSWVFGPGGKNFVSSMRELAKKKREIRIVSDQWGRPTYSLDLAKALVQLLDASGIYHVANCGETSWYLFAKEILKETCVLIPISTPEFQAQAPRPLYSVLDTDKFDRSFGALRPWQDALKEFYA